MRRVNLTPVVNGCLGFDMSESECGFCGGSGMVAMLPKLTRVATRCPACDYHMTLLECWAFCRSKTKGSRMKPDAKASVRMLTAAEGGRERPVHDQYFTLAIFDEDKKKTARSSVLPKIKKLSL